MAFANARPVTAEFQASADRRSIRRRPDYCTMRIHRGSFCRICTKASGLLLKGAQPTAPVSRLIKAAGISY